MDEANAQARRIFSIGHSNHPIETFLGLLKQHAVEVVVDVRSHPYSKYAGQFDMQPLRASLAQAAIRYLFLGKELGGQPEGDEFYDADGHVLYARRAESPAFRDGIERLDGGARNHRVAILCGEEDPAACHRRLLVGRALAARGITLNHIRGDGRVQSEEELVLEENRGQGDLFANEDSASWTRSTQSVSRKRPPHSSSAR